MPSHEPPGKIHLWAPSPLVADAALKDLLKAHHKQTDTFHVVVRYTSAHDTSVDLHFVVPPQLRLLDSRHVQTFIGWCCSRFCFF